MPATEIKSSEVTRQIGYLFDRASRGETFAVTRYGRPLAVIAPPADVAVPDTVRWARDHLARYRALSSDATPREIETAAGFLAASLESLLEIVDPEGTDGRESD